MQTTFKEIIEKAQNISRKFAEHDTVPWNSETKVLDLASHFGQLAQGVLEKEGRKGPGPAADQLGQSMATILLVIMDLAADYGIDLEHEFLDLLDRNS